MNCKGCGTDLTGKQHKMVAHWWFCLECFDALLSKEPETPRDDPEKRAAVDMARRCGVCKVELPEGSGHEMLGLIFCSPCHEVLVKRPDPKPRPEPEEEELPPAVEQVPVDVRKTVECQGCGRTIPAIGSKDIEGEPYCPECYYTLEA